MRNAYMINAAAPTALRNATAALSIHFTCLSGHCSSFNQPNMVFILLLLINLLNPQSRVGPVEWLKPYTDETIVELGQKGVKSLLAVPIRYYFS